MPAGAPRPHCQNRARAERKNDQARILQRRFDRLDDIAAETGFSRYYLSRLFAEETGKTFAAYVRGRRLTEAVKELLSGAPDILSVAIGAGYGPVGLWVHVGG
jgi:AraC-like DNA-binding protein